MPKLLNSDFSIFAKAKTKEPSVKFDRILYWVNGTIKPLDVKTLKKLKSKDINFGIYQTKNDNLSSCFRDFFYEKEHYNYIGFDQKIGNIVISIAKNVSTSKEDEEIDDKGANMDFYYLLVRTNNIHYCAMGNVYSDYKNLEPNHIFEALLPKLKIIANFKLFGNFMITEKLNLYDDLCIPLVMNVGVLLQLKLQENEEQIFGNDVATPKLLEFLNCISNEINLQGFKGYKGGLDVKTNLNGKTGYYFKMDRREIMFHVGPLLPRNQNDREHILRKKFIGNNLITIIFQEENTKFNPAWLSSQFLHVFIIIQTEKVDEQIYYKICIAAKKDVPRIKQILPKVSYFVHGRYFRLFMHDLLFKCQEAALQATSVLKIFNKSKKHLLQTIAMIYANDPTFFSICQHEPYDEKDSSINTHSDSSQVIIKKIFKSKISSTLESIKKHFNKKTKVFGDAKTPQSPKKKVLNSRKSEILRLQEHARVYILKGKTPTFKTV